MVKLQRQLYAGCLFSGMGGFASGLVKAGFSLRWANDNDEYACGAFRHRFPEVRLVEKDIKELSVQHDGLLDVDVLAAGFPCQSFSQAGIRNGFEDPRGELFFEIPRILAEFEAEHSPRLVILENVPYLLHGAEGTWFDEVRRALRRAGYWFGIVGEFYPRSRNSAKCRSVDRGVLHNFTQQWLPPDWVMCCRRMASLAQHRNCSDWSELGLGEDGVQGLVGVAAPQAPCAEQGSQNALGVAPFR